MKHGILLVIIALLALAVPSAKAQGITLSLDQKEYYFKTGEEAIIKVESENSYEKAIDGLLSYTITQQVKQGNFQYSSSSTKSSSFSIGRGDSESNLNFGTSSSPMTMSVSLKFSYTEDEEKEVVLDGIKVHFVSDDSQKNNQQDQVSSSSEKAQEQQQSSQIQQQSQRMQEMMEDMFGRPQPKQNTRQKLQNNQLSQDSSALKQQIQKQIQEQEQLKADFQKQLEQNPELIKEHQQLLEQGYSPADAAINPITNSSCDFKINYQNQEGEQASLRGQLNDGEIQNLRKDSAEIRRQMVEQLKQDKRFQKFDNQLQEQGFNQQSIDFSQEDNTTNVQLNYINKNNETASIRADIANNTIEKVELVNDSKKEKKGYLWALLLIASISLIAYFSYRMLRKPDKEHTTKERSFEKPFDYKAESLAMLERSKRLFEKKEYKDAYGLAGQSLRLYLSYDNSLKKEITNDEIISHLKKHRKASRDAKECFDLCSLVEFAKYQANKDDFSKIIGYISRIISK
ncbi:hypothetical protein KY366_01430 [Candidatus Woesearchaeota archaeon]|nr:hypothetical protein [Candidatus Woesearchaeota archaeon]